MKKISAALLLSFGLVSAPLVQAAEETAGDYLAAMGTKIGRGLENVVTSPAEIPCGMTDGIREAGAAGSLSGLGKGLWLMCRRILVGVTEIGTFMIPMERTIPRVCSSKPVPAVA